MLLRPHHAYHESLVYKIFLAGKGAAGAEILTFADALAVIRRVHNRTAGVRQIVYLVGWQFDGHDSKYPAWSEVNRRLKRDQDASALDSLLWLMREAHQYNAVVSLHINMCDAYENSPLWDTYVKNDLLVREEDGTLRKGGIWGGEQCYLVCNAREWESGRARQRIDALLELVPLAEAGTVHIDAFLPMTSPFHKITRDDCVQAMREIIAYWHQRGVDVTGEWLQYEFLGSVPYAYHFNPDEASRLKYPPSLVCGGGSEWSYRNTPLHPCPWGVERPDVGCLYEEAWGYSIDADLTYRDPQADGLVKSFYQHTLPYLFLNRHRAMRVSQTLDTYEVFFSEDVRSAVRTADRHLTIRRGNRVVLDGGDLCIEAPWAGRACIAHSEQGGLKSWRLPED